MLKNLLNGLVTALSMYSIIPMPQLEWNKNTMKYALCFFPFVGVIIGGAVYGLTLLCQWLNLGATVFGAILVSTPVIISGAIHIDGLIDTGDAVYSRLDKEKKLEILKDPHVGAFGIILCVGYFVLSFGIATEFYNDISLLPILCLGYILSRCYVALSIVGIKTAKDSGLAYIFSDNASKKAVKIVGIILAGLTCLLMIYLNVYIGITVLVLSALGFFLFKAFCLKKFGGISGDLAGYLLCTMEFGILAICTFGVRI